MKKRIIWILVIVFLIIIPVATFFTIKIVTKPAGISLEEARNLLLEQGQELYTADYDEVYEWEASTICSDDSDTDWVKGYTNLVISNDFYIRYFQDKGTQYVIIVHSTGEKNNDGFRIVVADEWYVLEE